MSTTLDKINAGGGIRYVYVLAIEGYDTLITNTDDTSAVVAAWSGTEWSTAVPGLRVEGDFEHSIEPWQRSLSPNSVRFYIMDADGSDTFGRVAFANAGGNETELTAEHDCDATTFSVKGTGDFASSGTLYVGIEANAYTGKTSTTFTGLTRGKYSPFGTSTGTANQFGRDHSFPFVEFDTQIKSEVTDAPRHWTGKHVGLWMHRVVGDTLDAKSEAHLVYAGIIRDVQDTESGEVFLDTQDIRAKIKNTTLLHDQYIGRVADGIYLEAGWKFYAKELHSGIIGESNALEVVASGATGAAQLNAGVYKATSLLAHFNTWLVNETIATRLTGDWSFRIGDNGSGEQRTKMSVSAVGTAPWSARLFGHSSVLWFLGFNTTSTAQIDGVGFHYVEVEGYNTTSTYSQTSQVAPARISVMGQSTGPDGYRLNLSSSIGTLINQQATLPAPLSGFTNAGEIWCVLKIGDATFALARQEASNEFTIIRNSHISRLLGGGELTEIDRVVEGDEGEIEVKQVFVWGGTFSDFLLRVLSSTGTSGYNHATYDAFAVQMGAAIPWELLGSPLVNTLASLEAEISAQILVVIEKPTSLETEIISDLLLRSAWLVWHQGTLQIRSYQDPIAENAIHAFTEANKGSSVPQDPQRIVNEITSEYLCNVIKVSHDRSSALDEEYRSTKTFKHGSSISDYGETKAFEIKARHSYAANGEDDIEALISNVVGSLMPIYGRPVKVLRSRTIQPEFFESVAPGDLCTVTDNYARDPVTGIRGLSLKPGIVLTKRYGWGGDGADMHGEVDILVSAKDSTAVYSPSLSLSESDYAADTPQAGQSSILMDGSNGYDSVTGENGDIDDFSAGDAVSIIEIDPSDPASAQRWDVNIVSHDSAETLIFDANLTGIVVDGTVQYRMVSDSYSSAAASQKTDAYQADDADLQIENLRSAYIYGRYTGSVFSASPSTELPERYSNDMFGDGVPLSTHTHRAAARFINNAIDYKLAIQGGQLMHSAVTPGVTGTDWQLLYLLPVFFAPGNMGAAIREVAASPLAKVASTGSGKVRLTLSLNPPAGSSTTNVTFSGAYHQKEYTFISTSYSAPAATNIPQVGWFRRGVAYLSIEVQGSLTRLLALAEWQQDNR